MIVGTRGSKLALTQTKTVVKSLEEITGEKIEIKIIKTTGDKIKDSQLYNIDAKGIFTKELDEALKNNEIDFAVHSFKDLPSQLDPELTITATPPREKINEVLISKYSWDNLPENATIGTSSIRRQAFCIYQGKKITAKPIRGNIDTRIQKIKDGLYDGTIMAQAGINRLGLQDNISHIFDDNYLMPPAGQGALAVMTHKDSQYKKDIEQINHIPTQYETICEKTLLEKLGVGCQWPVGIVSKVTNDQIKAHSILLTPNGKLLADKTETGKMKNAKQIGEKLAESLVED
ncbi:MAG: hydroxymethylbilane synthase [Methanobacteriaceae archaeon]|nr:hydroxymethylbilane synthase [Methanobacteriaceae archaeon]